MFRRSKSKTPAFDKDTYESVVARAGSLGITEQERKAILKAIDKAIEDKKKELKPEEMSKKAFKALQDTLSDYADVIGDAASQKATDIIEGRIPMDLSTPVGPVKDFGLILTQIELAAEEITQNVIDFHNLFASMVVKDDFSAEASDKINVLWNDIRNTEESTTLMENFLKLREVYGKDNKQIKALRKQINALENTNRAFAKQYSRINFGVKECWWHLRDLAQAFAEQDKALKEELEKRATGSSSLDINLATDSSIDDSAIQLYNDNINALSGHLNDALAKDVFKDALPEVKAEVLDNIDFEKIAAEEAQKAYSTIESDRELSDSVKREAEKKFKELCATRAGSLHRLVWDSPGAAAEVIAKGFMAGVKAFNEGAVEAGEFLKEGAELSLEAIKEIGSGAKETVKGAVVASEGALSRIMLTEPSDEFASKATAKAEGIRLVAEYNALFEKMRDTNLEYERLNKAGFKKKEKREVRERIEELGKELQSLSSALGNAIFEIRGHQSKHDLTDAAIGYKRLILPKSDEVAEVDWDDWG